MLKTDTLTLGAYQTNCYIIWDSDQKNCAVIDPGYEPETVLDRISRLGLHPEAILLTHGHFDHVGGVRELAAQTACRVFLCLEDLNMPPMLTAGPLYYTDTYGEGDTLNLAGLSIRVLHTPGHTPGSVCLLVEDALFSGDTLFEDSCGRTDLPGGSAYQMRASLARLAKIEEDFTVYPGHGGATRLSTEKQYNPYLRGIL